MTKHMPAECVPIGDAIVELGDFRTLRGLFSSALSEVKVRLIPDGEIRCVDHVCVSLADRCVGCVQTVMDEACRDSYFASTLASFVGYNSSTAEKARLQSLYDDLRNLEGS
jgi:hypothetical protein